MFENTQTILAPSRISPAGRDLAELLTANIRQGTWPAGHRLPTLRTLAKEHRITVHTVQRAVGLLEEQGLIERVQGSGVYVREGTEHVDTNFESPAMEAGTHRPLYIVYGRAQYRFEWMVLPIVREAQQAGLMPVPLEFDLRKGPDEPLLEAIAKWKKLPPFAVIVIGNNQPIARQIKSNTPTHVPVIQTYCSTPRANSRWHTVSPDEFGAYQLAGQELVRQGHTRLGLLTLRRNMAMDFKGIASRDRNFAQRGTIQAVLDANLSERLRVLNLPITPDDPWALGNHSQGISLVAEWLKTFEQPFGVLLHVNRIECMRAACEAAKLEPQTDIDLIGIGSPLPGRQLDIPCVFPHYDHVAKRAVQIALNHQRRDGMVRQPGGIEHISIAPQLYLNPSELESVDLEPHDMLL